MTRFILLTILNIALPFILRAAYLYGMRALARYKIRKGMKDVTPPEWHFPTFKLIFIGLFLLTCSLLFYRLNDAPDTPHVPNQERPAHYTHG
jgi:hypothetical protein